MTVIRQDELLKVAEQTFNNCLEILKKKNSDYCGKTDAYTNFKNYSRLGLKVSVEEGILTRMVDKFSRLINLTYNSDNVEDEQIEDTIDDLINYAVLLKCWIINSKKAGK